MNLYTIELEKLLYLYADPRLSDRDVIEFSGFTRKAILNALKERGVPDYVVDGAIDEAWFNVPLDEEVPRHSEPGERVLSPHEAIRHLRMNDVLDTVDYDELDYWRAVIDAVKPLEEYLRQKAEIAEIEKEKKLKAQHRKEQLWRARAKKFFKLNGMTDELNEMIEEEIADKAHEEALQNWIKDQERIERERFEEWAKEVEEQSKLIPKEEKPKKGIDADALVKKLRELKYGKQNPEA